MRIRKKNNILIPPKTKAFIRISDERFAEYNSINHIKDNLVGDGGVFVDIGSHTNQGTLNLHKRFDQVIHLEPTIDPCGDITKSELLNDKIFSIDDRNLRGVDLIKVDIKGCELDVLKGATKTILDNNWPNIVFTCLPNPRFVEQDTLKEPLNNDAISFLKDLGYEVNRYKKTQTYIAQRQKTLQSYLDFFVESPQNYENIFWLGYEYEKLGHCPAAMTYYLSCAENTNKDEWAYESLIRKVICFNYMGGRKQHVKNSALLAASLLPERPEAYFFLSTLYSSYETSDRWIQMYSWSKIGQQASRHFNGARLKTKTPYVHKDLFDFFEARGLWGMGRWKESLEVFRKVVDNEHLPEYYRDLAKENLSNVCF